MAETLPAMQHDPNRPEDVLKVDADEDGVGGDDAADALRYLVATKPRTVVARKLRGVQAFRGGGRGGRPGEGKKVGLTNEIVSVLRELSRHSQQRNKGKSMKTLLRVSAGLAVLVAAGGCVVPPERNAGVSQPPPTAAVLPPNYEASEGEFVGVKLSQLAPEFLDEQAGKYIVFEGRFLYSHQGALLMEVVPRPLSLTDMMTLSVGGPDIMSARSVNVIYSVKDREMGRQFLEWSVNSPIKVYGYVLPANAQAKPKSGNNMRFGGIPVPTILLIKAVARPAA